MNRDDLAGEFGPIDYPALQRIRNMWVDLEPLVESTSYDNPINPTTVHVHLGDGLRAATTARFDIQWSERGMYSFHYTDPTDLNWRFDRHPNPHSPERHFHPPPDAPAHDADPSCITVQPVSLVTRAFHTMWRAAYEAEDIERLNSLSNPP